MPNEKLLKASHCRLSDVKILGRAISFKHGKIAREKQKCDEVPVEFTLGKIQ